MAPPRQGPGGTKATLIKSLAAKLGSLILERDVDHFYIFTTSTIHLHVLGGGRNHT